MRALRCLAIVLLACASAAAEDIKGNLNPKAYGFAVLTVSGSAENVTWRINPAPVQRHTKDGTLYFGGTPGVEYTVVAQVINVDWAKQKLTVAEAEAVVKFGDALPPQPPVPPQPPQPPVPPPSTDPFGTQGFKVLIVLEKQEQHLLTSGQVAGIFGSTTEEYIKGKGGEFAILDKDNTAATLPKAWQDVMKRPRASMPWVVIGNGKTGFEGPVPKASAEFHDLLKKYGGQ